MSKKMISTIAMLLVFIMLVGGVSAAILWNWTTRYTHNIFFAGTSGEVKSEITTDNSSCYISGTVTLYRKVAFMWKKVDTWTETVTGDYWVIQEPFTATVGTKYKATLTASVTLNGITDSISDEVEKTCN